LAWNFANELARHGPHAGDRPLSLAAARSYCARVTRSHYENFSVASVLLPRRLLPHFHAVYAYCRWADDIADEIAGGDESLRLLEWWRDQLLKVYAGEARHPVFVALRETIRHFDIPPEPFSNLLAAFEQDQRVKDYDTFDQLLGYCRNSANPVGHLVLYLFACFNDERAALSDEICTGLQLANFWQDVARDAAMGRIYLPKEDRERFGISVGALRSNACTPQFVELMRFEAERTRRFFDRGEPLLAILPAQARLQVSLFLSGGRAVLDAIEKQNFDVLAKRPVVSKRQKFMLLIEALLNRLAFAKDFRTGPFSR